MVNREYHKLHTIRENMKPHEGKHETLNDIVYWFLAPLILHQMMWHVKPFILSIKRENMKPHEGKHETRSGKT